MKNIDYLKLFFKKHNLSGRITVKYDKSNYDDYMSDIIFENGDTINIQDIIFDIESGLPEDVVKKWMEIDKENRPSLLEWIQSDNHYIPDIDSAPMDEYKKEMEGIIEEMKESIDKVFSLQPEPENNDIEDEK